MAVRLPVEVSDGLTFFQGSSSSDDEVRLSLCDIVLSKHRSVIANTTHNLSENNNERLTARN